MQLPYKAYATRPKKAATPAPAPTTALLAAPVKEARGAVAVAEPVPTGAVPAGAVPTGAVPLAG